MVFHDPGIEDIQSIGIRNGTGQTPTHFSFTGSDNTHTGTETVLVNEYIRKAVSWTKSGIQSKYNVELLSIEAIGSNITGTGLVGNDTIGSGTLFTSNTSFIGNKTDTFNVQVEGEIIIQRPS